MPLACFSHGWLLGCTGLEDSPVSVGSEQAWTQCIHRGLLLEEQGQGSGLRMASP